MNKPCQGCEHEPLLRHALTTLREQPGVINTAMETVWGHAVRLNQMVNDGIETTPDALARIDQMHETVLDVTTKQSRVAGEILELIDTSVSEAMETVCPEDKVHCLPLEILLGYAPAIQSKILELPHVPPPQ